MRADERSRARGRRSYAGAVAGAAGLVALTALGACKPSVDISFDQNSFTQVVSTGAVSAPEVCLNGEDDLSPTLQFALLDQRGDVIVPGEEQLVGFVLELNENFTSDNIFIDGQPRLFPSPDVPCGNAGVGAPCPVQGLAEAGFTCQQPSENATDVDEAVCARDFSMNVDTNLPLEYLESEQTDVVLLAAAGDSLFGIDPCGSVQPTWRSDPSNARVRAYISMGQSMATGPSFREIDFCTASYREAGTLNLIDDGTGTAADCFESVFDGPSSDPDLAQPVRDAIDDLSLAELNRGTNNYLEALDRLFDTYSALGRSGQLHVVLFTDGDLAEDDVDENEARGISYRSVIDAANGLGATIHVQQLDNRPPSGRGVPAGNLEALQSLACATGGTHSYVEDPTSLQGYATNLGRMVPSHYRARLNISGLAQLPIGSYKVEATVGATVDGTTDTFQLSAGGTVGQASSDTRFSVYNRGTCDAAATSGPTSCMPGLACVEGACVPDYGSLDGVFPSPLVQDEGVISCIEDEGFCVEDCAPNEDCVVLDVGNLPQNNAITACIDAGVAE